MMMMMMMMMLNVKINIKTKRHRLQFYLLVAGWDTKDLNNLGEPKLLKLIHENCNQQTHLFFVLLLLWLELWLFVLLLLLLSSNISKFLQKACSVFFSAHDLVSLSPGQDSKRPPDVELCWDGINLSSSWKVHGWGYQWKTGGKFPIRNSHTTPMRIPKDMGIVLEAYHKGVRLLESLESPLIVYQKLRAFLQISGGLQVFMRMWNGISAVAYCKNQM